MCCRRCKLRPRHADDVGESRKLPGLTFVAQHHGVRWCSASLETVDHIIDGLLLSSQDVFMDQLQPIATQVPWMLTNGGVPSREIATCA